MFSLFQTSWKTITQLFFDLFCFVFHGLVMQQQRHEWNEHTLLSASCHTLHTSKQTTERTACPQAPVFTCCQVQLSSSAVKERRMNERLFCTCTALTNR